MLVEPVQSRRPEWQPRDFLHEVRQVTHDAGAALIFDEVVTGFRVHPGGAQAFFDVRADLATYGKVIGGGMPIGVVAGRARSWTRSTAEWQFGDKSFPEVGGTFFAGTFVRHPLVLAAAKAALVHLRDAGPTLQSELNAKTDRLVAELNSISRPQQRADANCQLRLSDVLPRARRQQGGKPAFLFAPRERRLRPRRLPIILVDRTQRNRRAPHRRWVCASVGEMFDAGFFGSPSEVKVEPSRNGVAATGRCVPLTEAQRELWFAAQMGSDASCA